jgi:hypothetical protein
MMSYLMASSLLLMAGESRSDDVGMTKADLCRAILDAEAAIKTASVTCDYTLQTWRWGKGGLSAPAQQHGVCTFDSLGRCRYEGSGEIRDTSGDRLYFEKRVGVFDGQRMKRMEGNREHYYRGYVSERSVIPWPLDPRQYLYRFRGKEEQVGKEITGDDWHIVGWTSWDGRRLILVESKVHEEPTEKMKKQVFIDPERAFAVVRRTFVSYRPTLGGWVDTYVLECRDYSEVVPGIWVPARIARLQGGSSKGQKGVWDVLDVQSSNWVINAKLPDSTFELEFQPAILINDEQTGKTYQTVQVRDDKIVRLVGEGIEIYKEKTSISWKKIALWVSVGLASIVVLVLVLIRVRRGRRAAHT